VTYRFGWKAIPFALDDLDSNYRLRKHFPRAEVVYRQCQYTPSLACPR